MRKTIQILIVLLLSAMFVSGESLPEKVMPGTKYQKFRIDTSRITQRHFDKGAMDKYRNDPDFNYNVVKQQATWWDRFWNWVWLVWTSFLNWVGNLLKKLFGGSSVGAGAASVFQVVIVLLLVGLVVYIIAKLLGVDLLKLFTKKQPIEEIAYSESIENIHQINFDEAIEDAIAVKDFRLAVRLLYLRCLKQLSDAQLIEWQIEKTNYAYLNELKDAEQRRSFSIVTRQFEYVWYGDFPVDRQSFQTINTSFQNFKQAVL